MQRIRGTINYPMSGAPGVITLYTRTTAPENSASAELCSSRLHDAMTAGFALFPTSLTIVGDGFVDTIDPATGAITGSDDVAPWTVTGGNGTAFLPPASAICLTWLTSDFIAGRRVRGRTFLGPLSAAINNGNGHLIGADLTVAQDVAAAWVDQGGTDVATVVWHRPVGGAGGSDHVISATSVRDKFAVLRSRRD